MSSEWKIFQMIHNNHKRTLQYYLKKLDENGITVAKLLSIIKDGKTLPLPFMSKFHRNQLLKILVTRNISKRIEQIEINLQQEKYFYQDKVSQYRNHHLRLLMTFQF